MADAVYAAINHGCAVGILSRVILDFTLGLVAIVAAWGAARRWSNGYTARYGHQPPNDWMFSRVDDGPLERERRILIAILVLAVVVVLSVLTRAYAP
jgi:hypothetical protein